MAGDEERIGTVEWKLVLGGSDVPDGDVIQFTVDKDMNQPDMAVVVLKNDDHKYSNDKAKVGMTCDIKVAETGQKSQKVLFKGEICGIEPQYKGGGESRVTLRAFCKLHTKLAGKKSKTFQDKTDKQILNDVLGSIDFKGPEITHKHVTQDNMCDLDFARLRAARIGCFIWTEDGKLQVKRPELDKDSGIEFKVYENEGKSHRMKTFAPRMTAAQIVKSVEVRGWNPETKKPIVKRVNAEKSPLGDVEASNAAGKCAAKETFTCDQPIWSEEEAKALAEARLQEHNLGFMVAEAEARGNPIYVPGKVIKVFVNSQAKDRFDGKYFVMGTTHKYAHGTKQSPDGGYTTIFRLARNAEVG